MTLNQPVAKDNLDAVIKATAKPWNNKICVLCRKCYQKGARKIQGLFTCAKCGEKNADRNAAFNIA